MATNSIHIAATPQAVFDVLGDGWLYALWVVGTSHMRAVDAAWPAVGTKIHHAAGAWPMITRDETEVCAVEPGHRLELMARGRPFGEASIVIELSAEHDQCLVTMHEQPVKGPGKVLHNPASEALLTRRNTESLNRLAALCERRTEPRE